MPSPKMYHSSHEGKEGWTLAVMWLWGILEASTLVVFNIKIYLLLIHLAGTGKALEGLNMQHAPFVRKDTCPPCWRQAPC